MCGGLSMIVTLHGVTIHKVLKLTKLFADLYIANLDALKCVLMDIRKVGSFTVDNHGHILDYTQQF